MPRKPKSDYDARWRAVRARVLIRDGRRCYECGAPATSVDHIVPVSEAPHLRLDESNLRASCAKHNEGRVMGRLAAMARINRTPSARRAW